MNVAGCVLALLFGFCIAVAVAGMFVCHCLSFACASSLCVSTLLFMLMLLMMLLSSRAVAVLIRLTLLLLASFVSLFSFLFPNTKRCGVGSNYSQASTCLSYACHRKSHSKLIKYQ